MAAVSEVADYGEIDAPSPVVTRLKPQNLFYLQSDQTIPQTVAGR